MARPEQKAEAAALAIAREFPEMGQFRAVRELGSRGIRLSPSGLRAIWKRHGLETVYQRLLARQRDPSGSSGALSEAQRALLQRARVSRRLAARVGSDADTLTEVRRDQLIAAAARVFGEKGYEGASLREICAAAGILPGSLYYHFRSKEDLFVTVHADGLRQISESVDNALEGRTDPWDRLEAACAAHLTEFLGGNVVHVAIARSLFSSAGPVLERRLIRERDTYENRFRRLIAALDLPRDVDRTLFRLALLGALNWTRNWYRKGGRTPAEIARHLVRRVLARARV